MVRVCIPASLPAKYQVLGSSELRDQPFAETIVRHEPDTPVEHFPRRRRHYRLAVEVKSARAQRPHAHQDFEQFLLAVARNTRQTENFVLRDGEVDIAKHFLPPLANGNGVIDDENFTPRSDRSVTDALRHLVPDHQCRNRFCRRGGCLDRGNDLALAKDRHAIRLHHFP